MNNASYDFRSHGQKRFRNDGLQCFCQIRKSMLIPWTFVMFMLRTDTKGSSTNIESNLLYQLA
ncbi:hypothetical protein VCHA48P434_10483 [Vibrio chagasii]|nr:hypothetical protein VCHA48P434_10483 [Vibrio chagasii]